jgi:hypothetical protein
LFIFCLPYFYIFTGGDWEEDEEYEDEGDDGQEDEENFSALLQHQMNATWRSNLLPRSRFLELTVFKKMLSQGLHLTRHDGGIVKPTTVFADPDFRNLWWYKSVGLSVSTFPIASLLAVGTATDPKSGPFPISSSPCCLILCIHLLF